MSAVMQYLIVCPLVFMGGFVDAIAGGGGLVTLPAYLIAGLPAHVSIGTNKLSSSLGTAVTTFRFWKEGYIHAALGLVCAVFALIGSATGANLALLVEDRIFKLLLLIILPATAWYVFYSKALETAGRDSLAPGKTTALACGIALVIGIYDGFYGPGTGTFLLLLLTGVAHMDLRSAAGTTKVINLATNVAALATYLIHGKVHLLLGLVAAVFGIAGNLLGARRFTEQGSKIVKPVIALVLGVFFVRVVWELLAR